MRARLMIVSFSTTAALSFGCTDAPEASRNTREDSIPTLAASTADYAYDAPDTVVAGVNRVRFMNRDNEGHALTIVRLDDGRTLREFIEAYGEANRTGGARPEWASYRGGTALFGLGEASAIVDLEPGNYALVCFIPGPSGTSHLLEHGEAHEFVAKARNGDAPAPVPPETTVSMRMFDYSYELSGPITAGRQVVRVENVGADPHHVLLFKLLPGRTREDYEAWLETNMQSEAPAELAAAMMELSSGADAYLEANFSAGEYVLVCLVSGRDGLPHTAKGMIQYVQIG